MSTPIAIHWTLFGITGTWVYRGIVYISGKYNVWESEQLLQEIDSLQSVVPKGTITERAYTLVIRETNWQIAHPEYRRYTHMYPCKP